MTQYKWLPSEPTDEMVNAAMSSLPLSMPEVQVKQIYSLLWKAASEIGQEPLGYIRPDNVEDMFVGRVSMPLVLPKPDNFRTIPIYTHHNLSMDR
jgi:hypothetical protein